MEANGKCTIAIGATQEAEKQANSKIDAIYKGYISHLIVSQPLVMPYVRNAHLDLHIGVILKGRTAYIWFFDCGFACATIIGYAGFKLSFGIIILLSLLPIIK